MSEAAPPGPPAARDAADTARERLPALPTPEEIRERVVEVMRQVYPPARASGSAAANRTVQEPAGTDANASPPTRHSARSDARTPADVIPARMLNGFVYCPRLFYYEFVEGVFVESADTLRGKGLHRRVDKGNGALPPAATGASKDERSTSNVQRSTCKGQGAESAAPATATADTGEPSTINHEPSTDDVIHSRSVQMGSARLGATAKMDLIEARTGGDDLFRALEVCPVDYKAGAPREGADGNELWDADKMQLGVQALILRDNGYTCSEGVTYFSMGGWFYGITRGHELKNVFLRIEQFRRVRDDAFALELSRQFVHGKIRNHRTMLMRNHLEPPPSVVTQLKHLADKALTATSREELLGLEGAAAAAYFAEFNGMLKVADELADARDPWDGQLRFNFEHRNRRPPTDPVNALLSLGYSLPVPQGPAPPAWRRGFFAIEGEKLVLQPGQPARAGLLPCKLS